MTARVTFCFLLFLTGCCDCSGTRETAAPRPGDDDYCRICANHTMCLYKYDGIGCSMLHHADLDGEDIEAILDWHNTYRDTVANGNEGRGSPGPQRPAKFMMQLTWDDELAYIASRWSSQCNLLEKDHCRDVERFGVWQNVQALNMNSLTNTTNAARIHVHIQSWYDEVENFDSAESGLVNFTARHALSYVPFALSTVHLMGCGRAIYTTRAGVFGGTSNRTVPFEDGDRAEVLVCNYGPVDWNRTGELYVDGVPAACPRGTIRSPRYRALCLKFQTGQRWFHKIQRKPGGRSNRTSSSAAHLVGPSAWPVHLASLLLTGSTMPDQRLIVTFLKRCLTRRR